MGLLTTVALSEVLTLPAQRDDQQAMVDYELFLTNFPNLRLVPLDVTLARETASCVERRPDCARLTPCKRRLPGWPAPTLLSAMTAAGRAG